MLLEALVLCLSALAAESTSAHGGSYNLAVSSDGAGGLTKPVTFTDAGHPVE